jgi:pimeloyl-ACP methyl ester carboxylesterase
MKLEHDRGGDGDRLLVLLHGLSATRDVWRPMLDAKSWQGCWIAPDLRGHGASAHARDYSLGCHAADVAELVAGPWREIVVLGHSMGGAVGLALASGWFGIRPSRVHGLGIKVAWNADELAGLEKMAAAAPRIFAGKDEAMARFGKVSGLGAHATGRGVAQAEGGWRLAADPRTAGVGPPLMQALLSSAVCPIHLARGQNDTMVSQAQLAEFDPAAAEIAGAGHNAMIDAPVAVWDWLLDG